MDSTELSNSDSRLLLGHIKDAIRSMSQKGTLSLMSTLTEGIFKFQCTFYVKPNAALKSEN